MKCFKLNFTEFDAPKVHSETVKGTRFYFNDTNTDEGPYPSVTTILNTPEKEEGLEIWRMKVGRAEATKISREAACRGNRVHLTMENYVQDLPDEGFMGEDAKMVSNQLKKLADKCLDNILAIEQPLWSNYLRVAGTPDIIGDWNKIISVVDWKNSLKMKKEEYIHDYFMQKSAYAVMWEENTGIPIQQLVTVIGTLSGKPQVFITRRDNWIPKFLEHREAFDQRLLETLSSS